MPAREFPATVALLKRTDEYPKSGLYGPSTGFGYSRDELVALLGELSSLVSIGVNEIEHDAYHDMTSMRITVYLSLARSDVT